MKSLWRSAADGSTVEHHGEFFDIDGRLAVPPSAQGHPLLVQAGGSPAGRALAGREANIVFAAELSLAGAKQHYDLVKAEVAAAGRNPRDVSVLPGLSVTVGSTEEEARRRHEESQAGVPDSFGLARFASYLDVSADELDLDRPVPEKLLVAPDPSEVKSSFGFLESVVGFINENRGLSVRELIVQMSGPHRRVVGAPEQVADTIEHWYRVGAADGFNIMPDRLPVDLEIFVDSVVPILQARGLFRREYEATAFRGRSAGASSA